MVKTVSTNWRTAERLASLVAAVLLLATAGRGQEDEARASDLQRGQWVRVKGRLAMEDVFVPSEIEVREPRSDESLIGTAGEIAEDGSSFMLLGQRVLISARTEWEDITLSELPGTRIKVEGHFRNLNRFDAREISVRKGEGRDRIEGRIDGIATKGTALELRIMRWLAPVHQDMPLETEDDRPFASIPVKPQVVRPLENPNLNRDEDYIPRGLQLTETISFGAILEMRTRLEKDYDLDSDDDADRKDYEFTTRAEMVWEPSPDFYALGKVRFRTRWRDDEDEPWDRDSDGALSELYGYWSNPLGLNVDLQVGRQDFEDKREWLYDENLDAVRAFAAGEGMQLELSVSSLLSDGGSRNRDLTNYIGILSNGDEDQYLAAYVVDRRDHSGPTDKPIHFGVRAYGDEWIEDQDIWMEASMLRGYDEEADLVGYALDLGTTWSPPAAEPFYFTAGFAWGSGDDDPGDTDRTFRQTGLQDNNDKFGGVTSFRYYGEVMDPELANLQIYTLGVGTRLDRKTSLDLVFHKYYQDQATDSLINTDIKATPNGDSDDLGWGLDAIFGWREMEGWDVEAVLGTFQPGSAFDEDDDAWLATFRVRYRF